VTLASLKQQNYSVREIARVLARSASTISRELRRNASAGQYSSAAAQQSCQHRRRQGRPVRKLHPEAILFDLVQHLLRQRWSPEQIALTLARICPKGHELRVSHETIYHCIYAQPVGELRKELIACLRHAHNKRVPRRKGQDRRGQIPDMLSIHLRPPEVQDRQFPGHWEGDLIKGEGNASAVGTLVERTSRLLILVKLPHSKPASAANVLQAFSDKLNAIAQPMRQSLTYDQGREMALHKKLTEQNGRCRLLLRPAQPLAARLQREHQWTGAPVPAQGHRSVGLQPGAARCDCRPDQWSPAQGTGGTITAGGLSGAAPEQPATLHPHSLNTGCCTSDLNPPFIYR
jgi:IS30 family transposase